MSILEVKNITKLYNGVNGIKNTSFTINEKGVYGFLGPNGAGKTTFMRIISGTFKGRVVLAPKEFELRPTTDMAKEGLFNVLNNEFDFSEIAVLDLFAGTGNLGLESWSRGASLVTFIDESKESLRLVNSNINKCRAQAECTVHKGNAVVVAARLGTMGDRYDLAFCDPPYNKGWIEQIIALFPEHSFLVDGGYLIVERSAHNELPPLPECFENVREQKYGETFIDFLRYSEK